MIFPALANRLAQALEPWQSIYSNSKVISTAVVAAHLAAMLFGGGLAVVADQATLRALRGDAETRIRALQELDSTHRPVLIALAVLFITGVMLAAADVKTFLGSPVFYTKLALVALLLVNGAVLTTTEWRLLRAARRMAPDDRAAGGLRPATVHADAIRADLASLDAPVLPWGRLRLASWASLALWTATLVAGVALTNAS